jgi:NitT/TauT family transport system substrate-binding protein
MLSPQLKDKIKTIAELRGRNVAVNAPGSLTVYELGKVLETGGLALSDVEVKYLPFPQMGVAFTNGAIDAALDIPPFSNVVLENGLGVAWIDIDKLIKPYPQATIAYQINTDWAAKNPEVARNFMVAVTRGARDYCQAYHHGPNRDEIIDILMKYKVIADRALLERMPWQGRDPDGRFNAASAIDVQDWFFKEGMITQKFPLSRLIDTSYAEYVAHKLGPFTVINKESRLAGCR